MGGVANPALNPATDGVAKLVRRSASGPSTDVALTLPLFVAYHIGVVYLPVRNAADWMTQKLIQLVDHDPKLYLLLTCSIAVIYMGGLFAVGRGPAFRASAFFSLISESVVYAVAMRLLAGYVSQRVALAGGVNSEAFSGLVLSLGAGFYEELAFRVCLYGLGLRFLTVLFALKRLRFALVAMLWALVTAGVFSLWHYLGPSAQPLELNSFVFRWICGLVFILIYALRGFAPAVWTHTLYDIWVLVF
jgi:membrane protease YdiL (CAAX protease family)